MVVQHPDYVDIPLKCAGQLLAAARQIS